MIDFNRIHTRVFCSVTIITAGAALLSLTGCGTDMLTYAKDSQHAGIGQYTDGNYAEAAGSFRNAVRQDPTDPVSEYWLGLSYEKTGSYHEAVNAYKTALSLLPEPGSARYNQQLHDKAFDRLAHVIAENDPSNTETELVVATADRDKAADEYWLLGRIFRYRGDADTAMDNYHRSIQIDPDNFMVQKEFGLYLETLGQDQQAAAVLRDAYRLRYTDDEVNNGLLRLGLTPGPDLLQTTTVKNLPPAITPMPEPAASTIGPGSDNAGPHD